MKEMHPYLVELEEIAARRKNPIYDAFQGAQIGEFVVLAPTRDRYIRDPWTSTRRPSLRREKGTCRGHDGCRQSGGRFRRQAGKFETYDNPPATSASNETSVVQNIGLFLRQTRSAYRGRGGQRAQRRPPITHRSSASSPRRTLCRSLTTEAGATLRHLCSIDGSATRLRMQTDGAERRLCRWAKTPTNTPEKKVKNAFIRRGYAVHATRGIGKRHHSGFGDRLGWSTAIPEEFSEYVGDE